MSEVNRRSDDVVGAHKAGRGVRARRSDDVFALFYRRHHPSVLRTCLLYLNDYSEAEDAVQETFLKAWRDLERSQVRGSGRTWLLVICRNVCIDRLRRRPKGAAARSLDDGAHIEISDARSNLDDQARLIDLKQALWALGAEEREAWFVVDVLGYTSKEAAARVVAAPAASTVRSRVSRARRGLAAALSEQPAEAGPLLNGVLNPQVPPSVVECRD